MTLGRVVSKGCQVRFSWVPAHVGVVGNEAVDRVAKKALREEVVTLEVKWSKREAKSMIWAKMMERWQVQWDEELKGRHLYRIQRKGYLLYLLSPAAAACDPAQVKKKWSDLKIATKRRVSALKRSQSQTGGGPPDPSLLLTPTEERVAAFIGTVSLEGITGGGDTDDIYGLFRQKTASVVEFAGKEIPSGATSLECPDLPPFSTVDRPPSLLIGGPCLDFGGSTVTWCVLFLIVLLCYACKCEHWHNIWV
ncbi:hypothetical protein DPEC_G00071880 [Dallia pectoralis]|uniref:Uncharacterized protein n=1 Tax=Dallia pectoralis TaxID=75939 RepID=A0ACC2H283_DALPE|nr:hypothetical protein DPEC_G00071880 [Dallia pectoralis]